MFFLYFAFSTRYSIPSMAVANVVDAWAKRVVRMASAIYTFWFLFHDTPFPFY